MARRNTTKIAQRQAPDSWFPNHPAYARGVQQDGIIEYTLRTNGLKVLLSIDRGAPIAGVMVTYAVGSRNEGPGQTGAAHLLEHMMFKGSKQFNKKKGNDAWQFLERVGARINATTWLDRTNYFEVVPKEHLSTALAFEADRMRSAFLTDKDFTSEKTVVLNELERGENEPMEILDVEMWKTAFKEHPYKHPTIGLRADVEAMSVATLSDFYNTYYFPDNATLSVFGDIEPYAILSEVVKHYGALPRSSTPIAHTFAPEPPQQETRRVGAKRAGSVNLVGVAHRIPGALHDDTAALYLAAQVLGVGKRSRLYQALVEKNLVTDVVVFHFPFRDENLLLIYAYLAPGVAHAKVEEIIVRECERLAVRGAGSDELAAAKAKAVAEMSFSRDGVYAALQSVGNAIALGDWTWYVDFPEALRAVDAARLKAVAARYFTGSGRTIGHFKATQ